MYRYKVNKYIQYILYEYTFFLQMFASFLFRTSQRWKCEMVMDLSLWKGQFCSVGCVLEGEDCALWNVKVYFTNKYHRFPTSSDWGHIRPYKVIKGLTTYCYYSSEEPSPDQMQYSRTSNKDKMLNACIVFSPPMVNEHGTVHTLNILARETCLWIE